MSDQAQSSNWLPIDEIARRVTKGSLKAVDLVEISLKMIDEKKQYNAVIGIMEAR